MARDRTYTDRRLVEAIAASSSWRGTLRELGLVATSAGAMRSARAHADRLGIDYRHFKGLRRWSDDELRAAVAFADAWSDVVELLGLEGASAVASLKGSAARLGLDTDHLTAHPPSVTDRGFRPDLSRLDRAGSLLAASWFTLCGHDVAWPLEPSRYDLLVRIDAGIRRVKTTTARAGDTWKVYLSTSGRERRTYDPEENDDFFNRCQPGVLGTRGTGFVCSVKEPVPFRLVYEAASDRVGLGHRRHRLREHGSDGGIRAMRSR